MPLYLLLATAVIMACILSSKISNRLGIPMLLIFIGLGMFFGSDGVVKISFDNFAFAEQICSIALIFIMFYGGFGTKWSEAKPVAKQAILLSTVGVILTACITGLFCYFFLKIPFVVSLLLGSVVASTDAASVFSILRSKRLSLKDNTASLLELESGSNDPCAYMMTMVMIAILQGSATTGSILYQLFAQIAYGLGFGVVIAFGAYWVLKNIRFVSAGFDAIFVFAVALLSYAAPALVGGNGYLSAYMVGIILGNLHIKNKRTLVPFFDGLTGLTQMLIFFLLGLISFPSKLPAVALPSILIALFLTFVARPIAVALILTPFGASLSQQLLVSWSGLRGAASIVFAIMVMIQTQGLQQDIFHIVFGIVLFSILIQGSLIPLAAKKLDMIDLTGNVLKTFTDYTDEVPVQFIRFNLTTNHQWVDSKIRDILLPPNTLLVLIRRKKQKITPNGDTMLKAGDELILTARSVDQVDGLQLSEVLLSSGHEWVNQTVAEIPLEVGQLIIMIEREGRLVIPRGSTKLMEKDTLVLNRTE